MTTLGVQPVVSNYGPDEEELLRRRLDELRDGMEVREVRQLEELLLRPDGTLRCPGRNGYRFTLSALKQVCALLAPGLFSVIDSLSGQVMVPTDLPTAYSLADATQLYNFVLRRRYESRLQQRASVVWNTKDRLIEGVFGARYTFLENRELYDMAREAVAASGRPMRFWEATRSGRRMSLRFASRDPLFTLPAGGPSRPEPEPYLDGFYFANSEAGRECSVRAAALLIRARCDTHTMTNCTEAGARLVHSGHNLQQRLKQLLRRVLEKGSRLRLAEAELVRLAQTPLGLSSDKLTDAQAERIIASLRARNVSKPHAQRVLQSALSSGGGTTRTPRPFVSRRELESRTALDIYHAMTQLARQLSVAGRENLEQLSYELLRGKLSLQLKG